MNVTAGISSAGISFGVEDEHNFFRLEAEVIQADGTGKWRIEKILDDERIVAVRINTLNARQY